MEGKVAQERVYSASLSTGRRHQKQSHSQSHAAFHVLKTGNLPKGGCLSQQPKSAVRQMFKLIACLVAVDSLLRSVVLSTHTSRDYSGSPLASSGPIAPSFPDKNSHTVAVGV